MVEGFGEALRKVLRDAGCSRVRQGRGDHEIWPSPITGTRFVVDGRILSRHTANAVPRQAGLPKPF